MKKDGKLSAILLVIVFVLVLSSISLISAANTVLKGTLCGQVNNIGEGFLCSGLNPKTNCTSGFSSTYINSYGGAYKFYHCISNSDSSAIANGVLCGFANWNNYNGWSSPILCNGFNPNTSCPTGYTSSLVTYTYTGTTDKQYSCVKSNSNAQIIPGILCGRANYNLDNSWSSSILCNDYDPKTNCPIDYERVSIIHHGGVDTNYFCALKNITCNSSCSGKECGSDGCVGTCGACSSLKPKCDTYLGKCHECLSDSDCAAGKYCDTVYGLCSIPLACSDTDAGYDYYVKGSVTSSNGQSQSDTCGSGPGYNMIESICDEHGEVRGYPYMCPDGCEDGACISNENASVKCYNDNDCGMSSTVKYCNSNNYSCALTSSYICNYPKTTSSYCASGGGGGCGYCPNGCINGDCAKNNLPDNMEDCLNNPDYYWDQETDMCYKGFYNLNIKSSCSDPDGGRNYYLYAHTYAFRSSYYDQKDKRIRTGGADACISNKQLLENYCSNEGFIQTEYIDCPNGCKENRCIPDTNCIENWQCTPLSPCINYQQIRTCIDMNGCGTLSNKPFTYSSCTNSIEIPKNINFTTNFSNIQLLSFPDKFYINAKEVTFQKTTEGSYILSYDGGTIETKMEIVDTTADIYVKTSAGWAKKINILPNLQDLKIASDSIIIEKINSVEIIEKDGEAVYLIKGIKSGRLFGFIPANANIEQKINVETGKVVETIKPWWGFLAGI